MDRGQFQPLARRKIACPGGGLALRAVLHARPQCLRPQDPCSGRKRARTRAPERPRNAGACSSRFRFEPRGLGQDGATGPGETGARTRRAGRCTGFGRGKFPGLIKPHVVCPRIKRPRAGETSPKHQRISYPARQIRRQASRLGLSAQDRVGFTRYRSAGTVLVDPRNPPL